MELGALPYWERGAGPPTTVEQIQVLKGVRDDTGLTTIRGLVIPVDWDAKGNITAAAISTPFEEEYLLEHNARGEELLAFVRERVKVSGLIRKDELGNKVISVTKYEILEE
jgi:hypothetical protein